MGYRQMLKPTIMLISSFLVSCIVVYFSKKNFKYDPITIVNISLLTCLFFIILSSNLSVSLSYENFTEHNKNKSDNKSDKTVSSKKNDSKLKRGEKSKSTNNDDRYID